MAEKRLKIILTIAAAAVIILISAFYFAVVHVFPKKYDDEIIPIDKSVAPPRK